VYSVNSAVSLFSGILLYGVPVIMIGGCNCHRNAGFNSLTSCCQVHCKLSYSCLSFGTDGACRVTAISVTRLVLVINGRWLADMSWSYNPMLAVEVSEVGATLISLSIPGVKPLVGRLIHNETLTTKGHEYNSGSRPHRTALRKFRSTHSHPAHDTHLNNLPESAE
jgi:hypothetical protein